MSCSLLPILSTSEDWTNEPVPSSRITQCGVVLAAIVLSTSLGVSAGLNDTTACSIAYAVGVAIAVTISRHYSLCPLETTSASAVKQIFSGGEADKTPFWSYQMTIYSSVEKQYGPHIFMVPELQLIHRFDRSVKGRKHQLSREMRTKNSTAKDKTVVDSRSINNKVCDSSQEMTLCQQCLQIHNTQKYNSGMHFDDPTLTNIYMVLKEVEA